MPFVPVIWDKGKEGDQRKNEDATADGALIIMHEMLLWQMDIFRKL